MPGQKLDIKNERNYVCVSDMFRKKKGENIQGWMTHRIFNWIVIFKMYYKY